MDLFDVQKVVNITDICITTNSQGLYKVKPMSDIVKAGYNRHSFDTTSLWIAKHLDSKKDGAVLFGAETWFSNENSNRHLNFPCDSSEIAFQLRIYALVSHFQGHGKGYTGEKLSTLQTKLAALKRMGSWLIEKGYNSFHQLDKLSELKLRTLLTDYITKVVKATSPINKPRVFHDCFNSAKSLGLISDRVSKLLQEVLNEVFKENTTSLSHPIIPTCIARNIAKFAKTVIEECSKRIEAWEASNDIMIEYLLKQPLEHKKWKGADLLNYSARCSGAHEALNELAEYFVDLKVAVYIHILLFTGMRYNEVLSCRLGCADKSDPKNGKYLVEAETHKTVETAFLDTWIANEDTYIAIKLLERYVKGLEKRAKLLLNNYHNNIKESLIHNIKVGMNEKLLFGVTHSANSISYAKSGHFKDLNVKSPHFADKFDLTVTSDAIEELERLDQNYSILRGKNRGIPYVVGDSLRLSNHMFRHTFAYFVVANKLGELDDIADQFKHLTLAMTKIYADKGVLSHEELIDLVDGYEQLMTVAIANELTEQASKETLRGGAGERFNKAARELVIGVTNSNSPNAQVISQIHFKDLAELKRFFAKNLETIRGLPHGYCTAGDSCKINGASVPSGCVYCPSFIVAESHKIHWKALKIRAEKKLAIIESLPLEKQQDMELFVIAYKKDLKAAEYALNSTVNRITQSGGVTE